MVSDKTADSVLSELKEYASEVDLEFVRKSVRCIGRFAIRVESAADKCVSALLELIETKISYVVQEAVVVMRDIFRRFPDVTSRSYPLYVTTWIALTFQKQKPP